MQNFLLAAAALLGLIIGFGLGLLALRHITKGQKIQKLLEDKDAKLWLGAFGWFFAFLGAYLGYRIALLVIA